MFLRPETTNLPGVDKGRFGRRKSRTVIYLYIITIAWVLFWNCFCKDIKIFLQLTRWSIIGWEKGVKIVEKKSRNYLEVAWKSPYLCTRFERETPLESDKNRFWKILKKVPKSFGDSEKWLTFAPASNATHGSKRYEKRFWKNSEKFFQKDLVVRK